MEEMIRNIKNEYDNFVLKDAWLLMYYKIGKECQQHNYTCIEAKKPHNKSLNRYRDVNPYDHTRVKLKKTEKDYINANFVEVTSADRKYILTQGPLVSTTGHFWLMIWEQASCGIIMLNKLIENNESKCHQYWPSEVGSTSIYDDVNLSVQLISEENKIYYIIRKFNLRDLESGNKRSVIQFHYITWPDFGVPKSPTQFIDFLNTVRSHGVLETYAGPAIVHCSAGIGRSGTFCLVDSTLISMERNKISIVNVKDILIEMRSQRMGLVQTTDQFRFSYQAILEGVKSFDPYYKPVPIEENSEVEVSTTTLHVEQSIAPPLPPRGSSLETCPCFGPLPLEPELSEDGESTGETSSSDYDTLPCKTSNSPQKENPTLRYKPNTLNLRKPFERRPSDSKKEQNNWLPISMAIGVVLIGFIYLLY